MEDMPIAVLPDKSALVRIDESIAPVCGQRIVKDPPPPLGVTVAEGFVVETQTIFLVGGIIQSNGLSTDKQTNKQSVMFVFLSKFSGFPTNLFFRVWLVPGARVLIASCRLPRAFMKEFFGIKRPPIEVGNY